MIFNRSGLLKRLDQSDRNYIIIFLLAAFLSCIIAWLTPPFSNPDEGAHYLRAFEVSRGHWINTQGNVGTPILCRDYLVIAKQYGRVAFYQDIAEKMQPNATECTVSSVNTAGIYSPIPYLAAAIGMRIGEEQGKTVETRLKMGRMANALATSLICLLSVLAVQQYRLLLTAFALIPACMWLRASLSADALTIATSLCYLAYALRLNEKHTAITFRIIFEFCLLAFVLGSMKPAYGLLSFSSLILLKRSNEGRRNLLNAVILAVPGFAAITMSSFWALVPDASLIYINTFGGAAPTLQWQYISHNPLNLGELFFNTFKHNFSRFLTQAFMPVLRLFYWMPAQPRMVISTILSIFMLFIMTTTQTSLRLWQRITLFGVALGTVFATTIPLYLTYTHVGDKEIIGLQGRYFLPPLFYAVVAGCLIKPWQLFANHSTRFNIAVVIPMTISFIVIMHFSR
jgi:uncharacterized membrane protein